MAPARGRRLARSSRSGRRPRRPRELAPGRHAPEELPLLGVLTHRSSIPLSASARTSAPRRGTGGGRLASEATSASGGRRQAGSLRNLVDRVPTPVPLAKGSRFELANGHSTRGLRARRRARLRRAAKTAARCRGAHDPVGRRRRPRSGRARGWRPGRLRGPVHEHGGGGAERRSGLGPSTPRFSG